MKPKIYLVCPYCGASSQDDYCMCCGSPFLLEFPDYLFEKFSNSSLDERRKILEYQENLKMDQYRIQSRILSKIGTKSEDD